MSGGYSISTFSTVYGRTTSLILLDKFLQILDFIHFLILQF